MQELDTQQANPSADRCIDEGFEGRSYRGWNHHVTLVSVAHAFLTLERQRPRVGAAA